MAGFTAVYISLTLSIVVALVRSQIPIPSRPQGFPYNKSSCQTPVHLEVFTDLLCPTCQNEYPTVLKVADHYGPNVLSLNLLMFPLPYHRVAYLAAQVSCTREENCSREWQQLIDSYIKWCMDTCLAHLHCNSFCAILFLGCTE